MSRTRIALASILVFATAVSAIAARAPTLVLYNGSPSAPRGFYIRAAEPIAPGVFVTVRAADVAPAYARLRDFADPTDHFIKRVAAAAGARLCADGDTVTVDGTYVLARAERDSIGRALPRWSGCRVLRGDEVLLLGDTPDSFDGRYWGPTRLEDIEGVWRPLNRPAAF